jgi:hypothetical protein
MSEQLAKQMIMQTVKQIWKHKDEQTSIMRKKTSISANRTSIQV